MIKFKSIFLTLVLTVSFFACEQEQTEFKALPAPDVSSPSGESGSADFSKFVSIGGAYTAGFGDGGLLHSGLQPYSVGRMIAVQLAKAGGSSTFIQPDINSENGHFNDGADGIRGTEDDQGRWFLSVSRSTGAQGISRAPGDWNSVITPYQGDMTAIQNFAVGKQTLGQFLVPNAAPYPVNPYFARFDASSGTVSSLDQMIGSGGTFFMAWLGAYDFLAHYARGGSEDVANGGFPEPTDSLVGPAFEGAIQKMVGGNTTWKGVVGTVPDVLASPFFQIINPTATIPLDATDDAATLGQLAQLAGAYNQTVDGFAAVSPPIITSTEAAMRKLSWSAGVNALLVFDANLTDLGPYWDQMVLQNKLTATQRAMLEPYRQARMAKEGEIAPLLASSVIGTNKVEGDPTQGVWGVSAPLPDVYFLTGPELQYLERQRLTFNEMIKQAVATYGDGRIAVADFDGFFANLAGTMPATIDGTVVTYSFFPPTGMWSVDGLLPNGRGYTLMANKFIDAINNTFGATVPHGSPGDVPGTRLPATVD